MHLDDAAWEADLLGSRLGRGRYHVERVLGRGGAAVVVAARDTAEGALVALKVSRPRAEGEARAQRRFAREARVLSQLRHPHLVRVIGLGEESSGLRYAVMELVPGGSASDRLRSGRPFPPRDALRVCFEAASALVVAHEAGVIHRDIKPGNVLLGHDDHARLSDFGIARLLDPNTTAVTEPGDRLGTIGFEAPELRVDATHASPASDIYALGATLYALVVGRAPPDLALLHLNAAPLRGLPEPIAEVITRATRMQVGERYPNAEAFARACAEAHDQLAAAEGAPLRAEAWMRSLERHRLGERPARLPARLVWAAVAVAVALVAIGVGLRY